MIKIRRILGLEYRNTKKQLQNFSNELKALGSKNLSNGDLMRYRERYNRILNAKTNKNLSKKEITKLEAEIEEFRVRFKHLGFFNTMDSFMPASISELASDSSDLPGKSEDEGYNLRSRRKRSDDEKCGKGREDYGSSESNYNYEYHLIEARLSSFMLSLENESDAFTPEGIKRNQCTLKQISEAIQEGSFPVEQFQELSRMYNDCASLFRNLTQKTKESCSQGPSDDFRENIKHAIIYRGYWSKPNPEDDPSSFKTPKSGNESRTDELQHKTIDLPQVHSSGFKTEEAEYSGQSSCLKSPESNKSIDWEVLAHERSADRNLHKVDHSTKKSYTHLKPAGTDKVDKSGLQGQNHDTKQPRETAAAFISRHVPRNERSSNEQERNSLGECRTSNPGTYSGDSNLKPREALQKETFKSHSNYRETRFDSNSFSSVGSEPTHDQPIRHKVKTSSDKEPTLKPQEYIHNQYIYSGEFRGRARFVNRYTQNPEESRREFFDQHSRYHTRHHDVRNFSQSDHNPERPPRHLPRHDRLEDGGFEDNSRPSTHSDRISPAKESYDQRPRHDHVQAAVQAREVKEEPLEILDVHKFFRDDFDLNRVDALDSNLEKFDAVDQCAKTFESKVKSFDGDLLEFFVLDEKLMRLIEKLDKIKCSDDRKATQKKVELIEYIKGLHAILDERAKDV